MKSASHRPTTKFLSVALTVTFALTELVWVPLANAQNCDPAAADAASALIGQVPPPPSNLPTEAELDALKDGQGRKLFIDATTYQGGRSGWGRNSVEQEAVYRLKCVDEPQVELDRAELFRILGADDWERFRPLREPESMLAFTLNQDPNLAPWNDESHAMREQVGYVWFGVSTSRGALQYDRRRLEINGERLNEDQGADWAQNGVIDDESEIEGTIDFFLDRYLETPDFRLTRRKDPFTGQPAPANDRIRARYEDESNPVPNGTRLLIQSKVAIPCPENDPDCVKTTAKRDSRDVARRQSDLDNMQNAAIRGFESWGSGNISIGQKALYEQLVTDGLTLNIGRYRDVLVLEPKLTVASMRTRYHMDGVDPRNILNIHTDGTNWISDLRDTLAAGSARPDLEQYVASEKARLASSADPADQALAASFDTAMTALSSDSWLVDTIVDRTGLSKTDVEENIQKITSANRFGSRPSSIDDVDQQKTVAHAISDLYHEVGAALGHDDREMIRLIVGEPDDDEDGERFEIWLENQGTNRATRVATVNASDFQGGQTRIPTTREGVTLEGDFSGLEIRTRVADGPDPDDDDSWGDWQKLTPGMQLPTTFRGGDRLESRFEIRQADPVSTTVSADAASGATEVQLADVSDLSEGDRLTIGSDTVQISAIDPATNTVTLSSALSADVAASSDVSTAVGGSVQMQAHLPSSEATRFRQFREKHPMYEEWKNIGELTTADTELATQTNWRDTEIEVADASGISAGEKIRLANRTYTVESVDAANNKIKLTEQVNQRIDAGEPIVGRNTLLTELAGREVGDAEFARIGEQLRWEDARRAYKRIEAAGTASKALWFNNALSFYVPGARNGWGNLLIDTTDIAGFYPVDPSDTSFDAGDNDFGDTLMSSELVNEVQIELTNPIAESTVDRVTELKNQILEEKAGTFIRWAIADGRFSGSRPTQARFLELWEELNQETLPELRETVAAVNEFAKNEGAPWAQDAAPGSPTFPLTVSEFRTLSHKRWFEGQGDSREEKSEPILTQRNRRLAVRDNNDREKMLAGANFVFEQYRDSQNVLAQAKSGLVRDVVNDALRDARRAGNTNVPECSQWEWVPATKSKGTRGMEFVMERDGFDPNSPIIITPPPPPPVTSGNDEEPNDRIEDVQGAQARGNQLENGMDLQGAISQRGDEDTFRVKVHRGAKVKVELTPPAGQDYDLYVYDSTFSTVDASTTQSPGAKEELEFTAPGNRTVFYVRVRPRGTANSTEPYTVRATWPTNTN